MHRMHKMHIRVARLLTLSNHLLGHLGDRPDVLSRSRLQRVIAGPRVACG